MEINIERESLYKCVSRVQSIVEKKSTMPILSTVLLNVKGGSLELTATDLELGLQQTLPCSVVTEGAITLSGRKLFEILKESRSAQFLIRAKDKNRVHMSDGVARFELSCLPAEDYPSVVAPEGVDMVEIPGLLLGDMINKTIYAVTAEEGGFKLSGIYTEKISGENETILRMVATDGHRLSLVDKPVPKLELLNLPAGVMVPRKGMSELSKLASEEEKISIGFGQKTCLAKTQDAALMIRLFESKFPDYHAVIPEKVKFTVEVQRINLLEAMRKMLILSNERYRAVRIVLENDSMELLSTNPEIGEGQENIAVKYRGDRMEAGFNPRYFFDVLQPMESETVTLGFTDNSRPCILKGETDKGFLGLIMPMRV